MSLITVKISDKLDKELMEFLSRTKIPRDRFVEDALQTYLKVRKFRELREETLKYAASQGLFDDEDVFNIVS